MKYVTGNKRLGFTLHLLQGKRKIKSKSDRKGAGFTLIELLVGVFIFSLVVLVAVGLLVTTLRVQRKSIAIQNVQDNGRYLMGFMAKEIRMSQIITQDGESTILDINHSLKGNIRYSFSGGQIIRQDVNGAAVINSSQVQVDGRFYIEGNSAGDNKQPKVTIMIRAKTISTKTEEQAQIDLQTTLSQRKLD